MVACHGRHVKPMINNVKGLKHVAAGAAHFDGAYPSNLEVPHYRSGQLIEPGKDEAIWELIYFGHARGA